MRNATVLLFLLLAASVAQAQTTVRLDAAADATLIEDASGRLANGAGPGIFVGRTSQSAESIRRGLIRFDLEGAIPRGARIDSAELVLWLQASNPNFHLVTLHRALAAWSEGPSASSGGAGAPALPGDVTWIHRSFDDARWVRAGGHYVPAASAGFVVGRGAYYRWKLDRAHLDDLRIWLANPQRNFGWILVGDESLGQSAKNFASRENPDPTRRPALEITYRLTGGRSTDRP